MKQVLTQQTKRIINTLLKAVILLLVAWLLYHKLSNHERLSDFRQLIHSLQTETIVITMTIILLLMLANWLVEVVKWQYLCRMVEQLSLWRAVESVFCGLTWAAFTPNRIGEYGGRVLFLSPRKRVFGVVAMGVGALAQVVITNVMGALALCWFAGRYQGIDGWLYVALCFLGGLYALAFLLLYFHVSLVNRLVCQIVFLKKFHRFFNLLSRYRRQELVTVFSYSLFRFMIYTSQYCILMQVIIPGLPFGPMLLMIFILFFVQTVLPTLDLFDFGVRSLTASFFFGFITQQEVAIMASASCIWFVNLILPAILGSVFVLKINFFGNTAIHH